MYVYESKTVTSDVGINLSRFCSALASDGKTIEPPLMFLILLCFVFGTDSIYISSIKSVCLSFHLAVQENIVNGFWVGSRVGVRLHSS